MVKRPMDVASDDDVLLAPAVTCAMVGGLSEATIRRRVASGEFPEPIVLARTRAGRPARVAWRRGDVLAWCRRQLAASRGEAAR